MVPPEEPCKAKEHSDAPVRLRKTPEAIVAPGRTAAGLGCLKVLFCSWPAAQVAGKGRGPSDEVVNERAERT